MNGWPLWEVLVNDVVVLAGQAVICLGIAVSWYRFKARKR